MVRSTPLRKKTKLRNLRSYGSSKQSSMKIASALSCSSRSSSRTNHTRLAEVPADGLEKYSDRLLGMGNWSNPSAASPEQARTSWQRQCCYERCLNLPTPKRGEFKTRCRLCSKWQRFSRPRSRALDVEEQPRISVMSQPRTKRRYQSISSRPLEGRRQRFSSTTPSIINGDTTHDATSMSIIAVDMGMQRSVVTAPTAAGGTTATRTGWPRNRRALACSAE